MGGDSIIWGAITHGSLQGPIFTMCWAVSALGNQKSFSLSDSKCQRKGPLLKTEEFFQPGEGGS